jgi:hypothetical protein
MTDRKKIEEALLIIKNSGFQYVPLEKALEQGKNYTYGELIETLTAFGALVDFIKTILED